MKRTGIFSFYFKKYNENCEIWHYLVITTEVPTLVLDRKIYSFLAVLLLIYSIVIAVRDVSSNQKKLKSILDMDLESLALATTTKDKTFEKNSSFHVK